MPAADIVLKNATVLTLDAVRPYAELVAVTGDEVLMVGGTTCRMGGRTIIHADSPVTICMSGSHMSYSANTDVNLDIYYAKKIRSITIDGSKLNGWKQSKGSRMVSCRVPESSYGIIELKK